MIQSHLNKRLVATPVFIFKIQVDPVFIQKMVSTAWRLRWGHKIRESSHELIISCLFVESWKFGLNIRSSHCISFVLSYSFHHVLYFKFLYLSALHCMTVGHTFLSGSEKLRLREVFTSAWDSESLSGYIRTYVFVRFSSPHGHREMYSPELNSVHMSL